MFPKFRKRHVIILVMAFYVTLKIIVYFSPSTEDDLIPEKIRDDLITVVNGMYDS